MVAITYKVPTLGEEDSLERESVDYFRKYGFAIPFENYSVEDLISLGWVRLSETNF